MIVPLYSRVVADIVARISFYVYLSVTFYFRMIRTPANINQPILSLDARGLSGLVLTEYNAKVKPKFQGRFLQFAFCVRSLH